MSLLYSALFCFDSVLICTKSSVNFAKFIVCRVKLVYQSSFGAELMADLSCHTLARSFLYI